VLQEAPGVGLKLYITDILVTNDSTAVITFKLVNGSGGSNLTGTHRIAAPGGFAPDFSKPIVLSANTDLCLTTTGTSNYAVLVIGYIAP
jgi:hypothetical protein